MATDVEAEDILGSSLQSLYAYMPVTFWGNVFVHKRSGCTFESPEPESANWALHAASIWIASLFLADHIDEVIHRAHTMAATSPRRETGTEETLELGAGSGMPGIVLAKRLCSHFSDDIARRVTLSDYPDPSIIACLHQNIARNNIPPTCIRVVGHVWGDNNTIAGLGFNSFDTIIAADTIWNSESHIPFCQTLQMTLKKSPDARVYIAAGLHTGRWTIESFIHKLTRFAFHLESITERFTGMSSFNQPDEGMSLSSNSMFNDRSWAAQRIGESEADRRQWVVWMVIKWDPAYVA